MKKRNWFAVLLACFTLILTPGCSENDTPSDPDDGEKVSKEMMDKVIATYVDKTVIPTYALMEEKVTALSEAVDKFIAESNQNNLDAACDAWRAARKPWEESEA